MFMFKSVCVDTEGLQKGSKVTETRLVGWYMSKSLCSGKSLVFRSFVVTEVHGPLRVL